MAHRNTSGVGCRQAILGHFREESLLESPLLGVRLTAAALLVQITATLRFQHMQRSYFLPAAPEHCTLGFCPRGKSASETNAKAFTFVIPHVGIHVPEAGSRAVAILRAAGAGQDTDGRRFLMPNLRRRGLILTPLTERCSNL